MSHLHALRGKVAGDGCTAAPELWYHDCCVEHDRTYATGEDAGGVHVTRAQADASFRACLRRCAPGIVSGLMLPWVYWLAVRAFGWRYWG